EKGHVRLSYSPKIPVIQKAIYRANYALNNRKNKLNINMLVEISNGELVDKVSVLAIKYERITSEEKRKNVETEYLYLKQKMEPLGITDKSREYQDLLEVNLRIWEEGDLIRILEKEGRFDEKFIGLAVSINNSNNERARLKREINERTNSLFVEEKEHPNYE
ncbi:hypothetical protein KKH35_00855, partial [Patescibacteria group bacterium]|nr:hypothetical protein [Patescibacteria group bacterium]